jgi:hypothetical protein
VTGSRAEPLGVDVKPGIDNSSGFERSGWPTGTSWHDQAE